mgnify:CR=1 FL=1
MLEGVPDGFDPVRPDRGAARRLAARAVGLGSCITTIHKYRDPQVKELLGIPAEDQEAIRDQSDAQLRTKPGAVDIDVTIGDFATTKGNASVWPFGPAPTPVPSPSPPS